MYFIIDYIYFFDIIARGGNCLKKLNINFFFCEKKKKYHSILNCTVTPRRRTVKKEKIYGVGRRDFDMHICVVLCAANILMHSSDRIRV